MKTKNNMYIKIYKSPINGWIDIQFKYNEKIVNICRSLSTRRWDNKRKVWMIPENIYQELIKKLENENINYIDKRTQKKDNNLQINIKNDKFTCNFNEIPTRPEIKRLFFLKRPRDGYRLAELMQVDGIKVQVKDHVKNIPLNMESNVKLYPFQEECMQFLRKTNYTGLVALDMGLGKSIIAAQSLYEVDKGPALIVAPSSLLYQWQQELETHYNKEATIITSKTPPAQRIKEMEKGIENTGILITNYEFLQTIENNLQFEFLILDECQRIKNWKTKTAQTISKIPARRVIGLSGTPVENNLKELYNITDQIKPAFFGTMRQFYRDYIRTQNGNKLVYKNLEDVYKRLTNLMFRRNKNEVLLDLPSLIQETIVVQLTNKELHAYKEMLIGMHILQAVANAKVFASSSSLRMDIDISSKEKELFTLLNEIRGKKIVFSQSKTEIKRLAEIIKGEVFVLHGDIPKTKRNDVAQEFKQSDNSILLMTEVGTFGLNMQHANILINFDLPWTYARLEQRIGRIQRAKSEYDKCFVFNMMSKDTIDHHVMNLISNKKDLFDKTIDGEKKAKRWVQEQFTKDINTMGLEIDSEGYLREVN